jgi:hypothetical protein
MSAANWIAFAAAAIAAVSSLGTYRIAAKSIDGQRAVADRQAAGEILDEAVLELAEAAWRLGALEESLDMDGTEHQQTLSALSELRMTVEQMKNRYQRLSIRFRNRVGEISSVAEAFLLATNAIRGLLESDAVSEASSMQPPGSHLDSISLGRLDEVRRNARVTVQANRRLFVSAQDGFGAAAYDVVGINMGGMRPLSGRRRWWIREKLFVLDAAEMPIKAMRHGRREDP